MKKILLFILSIMMLTGCFATEKELLQQINLDPGNMELYNDLAELYYEKQQYQKAYAQYKKIESNGRMTDKQKYYMYISGSRVKATAQESWDKLYSFRNTETVDYKYSNHKRGASVYIPEHWIEIYPNPIYPKEVIDHLDTTFADQADFNLTTDNDTSVKTSKKKKKTNKRAPNRSSNRVSSFFYCAPGFIIRYMLEPIPILPSGITFEDLKRQLRNQPHALPGELQKIMNDPDVLNDLELFEFVRVNSGSTKKKKSSSRIKKIFDPSRNFSLSNDKRVYASWKFSEDIRIIVAVSFNPQSSNNLIILMSVFKDEYSEKYLQEFENFFSVSKF